MLRQAAEKTRDLVGDATSTSTILANAIVADGLRNVVAGASAIEIKRGLDRATKSAIGTLRALSRPVATRKEKAQVATISAHNDPTIGELVAEAIGGGAVIRVGAPTEAEMKSKKEALDDAISSTKAAVAEGIVPGGGLALLRCIEGVHQEETKCDGDERAGVQILKRALEIPTRQIAENSAVDGGVVVARMVAGQGNYGFDAARKRAIITYACSRN